MHSPKNVLLLMAGSIACAKATSLVSEWVKRGHRVRIACTPSAQQFIGFATLEGLSGAPVFNDTFAAGRAMDHIALAQWADMVVVCPATANLINKLAAGIADDAPTTLWQAAWGRGIPQFIVPAMNSKMWNYPATRESVEKLERWGVFVLPTAQGSLACGELGAGRMLEPAEIHEFISSRLRPSNQSVKARVLVTGGGTREAVDAVRYIGNHSTGRTAAALSDAFFAMGMHVTWLGAHSARRPQSPCQMVEFESFTELQNELAAQMRSNNFDLVIHAAAVSDFSVGNRLPTGKLGSDQEISLCLKPNPKLLDRIRPDSRNPQVQVVGFKLTAGADPGAAQAAVGRLFAQSSVDLVVHNELQEIHAGRHRFRVFRAGPDAAPVETGSFHSTTELAHFLSGLLPQTELRGSGP